MKKNTLTSVALYVLSVLLLLLGSMQLFQAATYILDSLEQGYITWGNDFLTIVSYISQACTNTYCFAIIFYVLGNINNKIFIDKE